VSKEAWFREFERAEALQQSNPAARATEALAPREWEAEEEVPSE